MKYIVVTLKGRVAFESPAKLAEDFIAVTNALKISIEENQHK